MLAKLKVFGMSIRRYGLTGESASSKPHLRSDRLIVQFRGRVKADILLNCAGIQRRSEAAEFTDEDIDAVLDINLKATLISCQEFAKKNLADGRPGKIINIASIISFIGGKNITPYAASKGGVMQLSKAFSNEWAEKGIQVNSIRKSFSARSLIAF